MIRGTFIIVALAVLAISAAAPFGAAVADTGVGAIYRTEDWRTEKHVPIIECPVEFVSGEATTVTVTVGKEIGHPNTATHHIKWIRLYFLPSDGTIPYEVGSFEFASHGESTLGADTSSLYTDPKISVDFRTGVPGVFYATSYCNIHGLWEGAMAITVVEKETE